MLPSSPFSGPLTSTQNHGPLTSPPQPLGSAALGNVLLCPVILNLPFGYGLNTLQI